MATDGGGPSVLGSALTAWRDAFAAATRMPVLFGIAILAVIVLSVLSLPFVPGSPGEPLGPLQEVLGFVVGLVQGFLLTPIAIAVHRYVLLGELAGSYRLTPADPRFRRFFLFTVLIQILMAVPGTLMSAAGSASGAVAFVIGLAGFVLLVVAAIVSIRTLILFPAIAVDSPAAEWSNALRDTKGHSWLVFFIVVVVSLPALVIFVPLYLWLWFPAGPTGVGVAVVALAQSIFGVLMIAAYAAVASRLYLAYADRLGHPPGLAPVPA
jgi:hypothetical protein